MNNMIWLSGSRGFIGSYLKESLISSNNIVKCISNSHTRGSEVIYIDFSKKESIREALRIHGVPDTFIHLGWGNVYEPHNPCHLNENLSDGMNLVDELYANSVKKILLIGSSSEYGDRTGALREDFTPSGDTNNYVEGKIALSKYGLNAAKKMSRIFIHVRLFYTYGAGQSHNSLINQLFQNHLKGNEMNLSPCEQYRDYIHVSEAAEGLVNISKLEKSCIINLGSGNIIQLKDFVKIFWKELGETPDLLKFGANEQPSSEQIQPRAFADLSEMYKLTGWRPVLSIRNGIIKTINDLKLHSASSLD